MPTLMIQGTTSDAGKSTVVAALCRWMARRGMDVAPFKPQNMALNAAVTEDGGEIGRSTALQALACGLAPHSDMNPVLLKPQTDMGAQVILRGRVHGNMQALDYHAYKRTAMDSVLAAWRDLSARHEFIIAEGAGSPAEINLRQHDIANMGFAEAVDCPVLLVADIDRGGVFATLVGTLELLSKSEQARVRGLLINRFRGDLALLQGGLDWLTERSGKPVLGVLPFLKGLVLDAEDSVGTQGVCSDGAVLEVVVPVLPRISNHNDFDPLRLHPGVNVRFLRDPAEARETDLIILPGSKHTRADLDWLKQQGWQTHMQRHLRYGGKLLGICGGFQMLGTRVIDQQGIEGQPGITDGLAWLKMDTVLRAGKQLRHRSGQLLPGNVPIAGYEMHNGHTSGPALSRPMLDLDGQLDGAISADEQIMGCYLHGLFEDPQACQAILQWAGLSGEQQAVDYHGHRQKELDRLADALEANIDLEQVMGMLGA